ncbi:hypothetical protein B0H13DRAFT_1890211 [Mycena leptocephala]|nr:hypothetical protein B0H13DRAFT_1890211 [Mycena leptocephala]
MTLGLIVRGRRVIRPLWNYAKVQRIDGDAEMLKSKSEAFGRRTHLTLLVTHWFWQANQEYRSCPGKEELGQKYTQHYTVQLHGVAPAAASAALPAVVTLLRERVTIAYQWTQQTSEVTTRRSVTLASKRSLGAQVGWSLAKCQVGAAEYLMIVRSPKRLKEQFGAIEYT